MSMKDFAHKAKRRIDLLKIKSGLTYSESVDLYFRSIKMSNRGWSYVLEGAILEEYKDLLGVSDGGRRLGFVLYYLYSAWMNGAWMRISKDASTHRVSSSVLSYEFLIETVINPLIELGHLDVIEGEKVGDVGFETRIRPSSIMASVFESHQDVLQIGEEIIHAPKSSPIIVRDHKKKSLKFSKTNRQYKLKLKNVASINAQVRRTTITVEQELISNLDKIIQDTLHTISAPTLLTITHRLDSREVRNLQYLCGFKARLNMSLLGSKKGCISHEFYYFRVFNQRKQKKGEQKSLFNLGGRFYSQGSNLPHKSFNARDFILFDGEETVELDYSSLHPNIAAAEQGYPLNDSHDPYSGSEMVALAPSRDLNKKALNALINCSTLRQANSWIRSNIPSCENKPSAYRKAVLAHNPFLKDYIGTDAGVRLQNIDSDMAEEIMIRFINHTDSCILPFHDSFRVARQYEDLLKTIMTEVWEENHPGTTIRIK